MTPPRWFGCADEARLRTDPQIGSAPYALGWVLIEHPGPWQVDAVVASGIAGHVLRTLAAAAATARSRILLVRRPGAARRSGTRAWAVVDAAGRVEWGTWSDDHELLITAERVRVPAPSQLDSTSGGAPAEAPVLLVCTHGLHDTCCAVRGRPVAAALAATWPEETWECSHLGGDRFAANVVVLPDGAYYGTLEPAGAVRTVRAHLEGLVDVSALRGLARFPPVAQVAIARAHERLGPWSATAVRADPPEVLEPGLRWRVALDTPAGQLSAIVRAGRQAPARLTCRTPAATSATVYSVTELTRE